MKFDGNEAIIVRLTFESF